VLIVAGSVAAVLSTRGPARAPSVKPLTKAQREVLASRRQAATWIVQDVGSSMRVACDPAMCSAIGKSGFPRSDLTVLGQGAKQPLTSAIVVETPYVTTLLGTSFITNYAPTILASFGNEASPIDIRVIAPGGAAAYARDLATDRASRKYVGTQLLSLQGLRRITVLPTAQTEMAAGEVDMRALTALVILAGVKPVEVIDFGNIGIGASPGVPLRYVDLAEHGNSGWMLTALAGSQYSPKWTETVHVDGITALRIDFGAPTPLLLQAPPKQ
jgi:hypothetical protein